MLFIFDSLKELQFRKLAQIYGYSLRKEEDFYEYLRYGFFRTKGALYCVWQEQECYLSALRLEPFGDGLILAGLETAPAYRRKGYATALVHEVLSWLARKGPVKVYSHIQHRNAPSLEVHRRCGFRKISDYSVLLDGTVSADIGTYLYIMSTSL